MPAIHLIGRLKDNLKPVNMNRHEWESGYWKVSKKTAECLVGGDLYIHEGQAKPSHFGGTISGYREQQGGEFDGRVIFRFRASMAHKDVKTDKTGWGREKKVLGCDGEVTRERSAAPAAAHALAHAQAIGDAPEKD